MKFPKPISLRLTCILFTLFLTSTKVSAQIPSSNPDVYLDMHNAAATPCYNDIIPFDVKSLNCDMLEQGQGKIWAVAHDVTDIGGKDIASGCFFYTNIPVDVSGFHVEYTGTTNFPGGGIGRDRALPLGAWHPDIVIGNDLNSPSDHFIIAAAYTKLTSTPGVNNVELVTCPAINVCGACTPSLGTQSSPIVLNDITNGRTVSEEVHIDLFGDKNNFSYNIGSNFIKALHTYVVTWTELDPNTNIHYIMAAIGDLSNPSVFSRYQVTPNNPGDPAGRFPDVAAMGLLKVPTSGQVGTAFIAYQGDGNSNLYVTELELMSWGSISPAVAPTANIGATTIVATPSDHQSFEKPRIEAKGLGDKVIGEATWEIVASVIPTGGGAREIRAYNDVSSTPVVCSLSSTDEHYMPVVTGVGEDMNPATTGNVGETQFSIGYYTSNTNLNVSGDFISNSIDINGGAMTNTNYYQINNTPIIQQIPTGNALPLIAISSSSNTGNDLFSVWYAGWDWNMNWGYIYYKFAGNTYSYKATGISERNTTNGILVYPNPTKDKLNIKGVESASYTIMNIMGAEVSSGNISSSATEISVESLISGVYTLILTEKETSQKIKFTKL
ncbi:MAG: T9SS type A sorting domain-containing protein [Flavipsychrobacter sp.]|nr:T9SS type A sorting domain-containing protein [Flavipsychrobacter sp.]